jgi:hypothetical protein
MKLLSPLLLLLFGGGAVSHAAIIAQYYHCALVRQYDDTETYGAVRGICTPLADYSCSDGSTIAACTAKLAHYLQRHNSSATTSESRLESPLEDVYIALGNFKFY